MNRRLTHTRLNLNHDPRRRSPHSEVAERSEAAPDMLVLIRPILSQALTGTRTTIPGFTPYRLRAQSNGAYLDFAVLVVDGPIISGTVSGDLLEVQLKPGLIDHPAAKEWLVDFERCVAWAWIDMTERRGARCEN